MSWGAKKTRWHLEDRVRGWYRFLDKYCTMYGVKAMNVKDQEWPTWAQLLRSDRRKWDCGRNKDVTYFIGKEGR